MDYGSAHTGFGNAIQKFHYIKGSQWSHEEEYRLIDSSDFYMKLFEKKLDLSQKLQISEAFANRNDYFIPITRTPNIFQLPAVEGAEKKLFNRLYLPIPKAVYLGYDHAKGTGLVISTDLVDIIKGYCNQYHIKLHQLNGSLDYSKKVFKVNKLNPY